MCSRRHILDTHMAPLSLCEHVHYIKDCHNYSTRMSNDMSLVVPHPNVSSYKCSFTFKGPSLWNSLPSDERLSNSFHSS